jgi:putative transposase
MVQANGSGPWNASPYRTFARNRSLRLPTFDYDSQHAYFVTVRATPHATPFAQAQLAEATVACLFQCRERFGYAVFAYCLMPDHFHVLARPAEQSAVLSAFIGAFKSLSTRCCWKEGFQGALWQKHFYEHIVRTEESLVAVVEYILDNPVRSGIAASRNEYAHCGILDEIPS